MSDPGWSTYRPDTSGSARPEGATTVAVSETEPRRGKGLAIGLVVLVVVGLVGVLIAVGVSRLGDGAGGSDGSDDVMAVVEGDFLADALAEAAEIEEGDPFEVMVSEYGVMLAYFDPERDERRDLSIDLDSTADYRIRATSDLEPSFDPIAFPLADLDADVLRELTEQAVAEAEDPSGFSVTVDVPHQAQQAEIRVRVYDSGDGVRLTAALDGSGVDIE